MNAPRLIMRRRFGRTNPVLAYQEAAGAVVSPCGTYRYLLWRRFGPGTLLVFVMLNPSTADARENDATVRKCLGFAAQLGFDGILIANAFAYRATDPKDLIRADWPHGPDNGKHLRAAALYAKLNYSKVVAAWGANIAKFPVPTFSRDLVSSLKEVTGTVFALSITKDGYPGHPLYLPLNSTLQFI